MTDKPDYKPLTPEQEAMIPAWKEKWLKIGLSTEPADRPRAEDAVNRLYTAVDLAPPKKFMWKYNPQTTCVIASCMSILVSGAEYLASVKGTAETDQNTYPIATSTIDGFINGFAKKLIYENNPNKSLLTPEEKQEAVEFVWEFMESSIKQVQALVVNLIKDNTIDLAESGFSEVSAPDVDALIVTAREQYQASNMSNVVLTEQLELVMFQVWKEYVECVINASDVFSLWNRYFGGQFWYPYHTWQSFWREVYGIQLEPTMEAATQAFQDIAESCCWLWADQNFCVICDRPEELHSDGVTLDNRHGPAIKFRDGMSIYVIGDVTVDEQIVMAPETQTIEQIDNEQNVEVKRIRTEQYGWDRYLQETGAKVLDFTQIKTLDGGWLECLVETKDGDHILCTVDPSTGRIFNLQVSPECVTCSEAQRYLLAPDIVLEGLEGINVSHHEIPTYPILRT